MKKYIVLSVNDNPEYLFYIPLTMWAWKKFGWEPILLHTGRRNRIIAEAFAVKHTRVSSIYPVNVDGYESETVAQISRLYAAKVIDEESYLMTGDIDMIPLSDYWKFNENEITVWGHDLTSYQHYPICYIGMSSARWYEIMGLSGLHFSGLIKRDLDSMPNAKSEDSVKRWVVDQDLITDRLNATQFPITKVHRGTYQNGYPVGRVDRSAWTLDHPVLIDCHMPRGLFGSGPSSGFNRNNLMQLLHKVWPNEDFNWLIEYTNKFKQLIQ